MNFTEKISLESVGDKRFRVRLVEPENNQEAVITHYLQSFKNENISNFFKVGAIDFAREILEYKYPENIISSKVAEEALQMGLFEMSEVPFPPVENPQFTFIDLFAGIGGFRIALQNLGGKCVFTSEWDKFAKITYRENFGEVPFGDITKESTKGYIPDDFDVLCGGFPCQPFSYAGKNEGFKDRTRGTLFFDVLDIIEKHKPKMFLLENVKGLVSHDKGETLKTIVNSLKDLGYDVHWKVLSSLNFGVPQKRERWYCVGFNKKIDFKFPQGDNTKHPTLRDIVEKNDDEKLKLTDFEIQSIKYHFTNSGNTERVLHDNSKYESNTKKGKHGVYSFQKADKSLRFHVGDVSKTQIQEAFYTCLDTYAPTIIANRVPKLWDIERRLSVLESKRIQSFPDNFIFPVSDNQAYKQLGNSVTVKVIQLLMENMIKYYNDENI